MASTLGRTAHRGLTLYSRSLASPDAVRQQIWPTFSNPSNVRNGRKFFRLASRGPQMDKWHELNIKSYLRPLGYQYASEEEKYWKQKKVKNAARGKYPTKKGEGKKKSRRK